MKKFYSCLFFLLSFRIAAQVNENNGIQFLNKSVVDFHNPSYPAHQPYVNSVNTDSTMLMLEIFNEEGAVVRKFGKKGQLIQNFGAEGVVYLKKQHCKDSAVYYHDIVQNSVGEVFLSGGIGNKFYITKLKSNGIIDENFGVSGHLIVPVSAAKDKQVNTRLDIKSDGEIYVIVEYLIELRNKECFVYRISKEGDLDSGYKFPVHTYGKNGIERGFTDIKIDPSDNIFIAGPSLYSAFLIKLNPDGALDTTFAVKGVQTFYGSRTKASIAQLQFDKDKSIYIAGYSSDVGIGVTGNIWRFDSTGKADNTFDSDGLKGIPGIYINDLQLRDNKIYVLSRLENRPEYFSEVRCFNLSGEEDDTYNNHGVFQTPALADYTIGRLHFFNDGTLIAASNYNGYQRRLMNITPNGFDNTFGNSGIITISDTLDGNDDITNIKTDQQGNIYLVGSSEYITNKNSIGIVKYQTDGVLDTQFGSGVCIYSGCHDYQ